MSKVPSDNEKVSGPSSLTRFPERNFSTYWSRLSGPRHGPTQPWEFAVVAGEKLRAIQKAYLERGEQEPQSEIARPYEFPEPYLSRREGLTPKGTALTAEYLEYRRVQNQELWCPGGDLPSH
jgi:hypothetical protein